MHINFNEGGRWLTFWFSTKSTMFLRFWVGPTWKGLVLFSFQITAWNPWK